VDWKWRRLEKDRRWTDGGLEVDSMDEMGTGGGLHEDPWGSVRYSRVGWASVSCYQCGICIRDHYAQYLNDTSPDGMYSLYQSKYV
jgi:hypothetical protein